MTTSSSEPRHEPGIRGKCRICGCTPERACPERCSWADPDETICSSCVEIIQRAGGAWRDEVVARVEAELSIDDLLLARITTEMGRERASVVPMRLTMMQAFALVGLVQLALRHPSIGEGVRESGWQFVYAIDQAFLDAELWGLLLAVRQGNDPERSMQAAPPTRAS